MQIVPLAAVPSQLVSIVLGGQNCQIAVYTLNTGLYADLSVNSVALCTTRLCRNGVPLVAGYLGFIGNLAFDDTQGETDPIYTGLGSRYQLVYLEASDL